MFKNIFKKKRKVVDLSIVNDPQSPPLLPNSKFCMLGTSQTRWSQHEKSNGILDSARSRRQT
jgi:hypothetical protein